MSWHAERLAAFDVETTGTDTENDRIVTAAISLVGGGKETESFTWLVNPGILIPAEATQVHGITNERARRDGMDASEAVAEITQLLALQIADDIPIVAFNARFDLTVLDREARRHGVESLVDRIGGSDNLLVVDPYVLDKRYNKFRKGRRTLSVLCESYGVPLENAHAADADALAAARIAWRLATTESELGEKELFDLHYEQIAWADEQGRELQEYFDSNGRSEVVERSWPVVPFAA